MTKINLNTIWRPENHKMTLGWIATTLSWIIEAELKGQRPPTVDKVMLDLGIPDERLAVYILTGTQKLADRLLNLKKSSESAFKEVIKSWETGAEEVSTLARPNYSNKMGRNLSTYYVPKVYNR